MFYRFIPTTIAFAPAGDASYFPSLPEVLMSVGYISLGIVAFAIAVKYFGVLPGEDKDRNFMPVRWRGAADAKEGQTLWLASR
jgi:Ni/Fe-hydrogenase subunit HybB-like protein